MSYAKLPKVVVDYPVGFQTINQARDNIQSIADAYQLQHHFFPEQGAPYNRHWSPLIPKGSGIVTPSQLGSLPVMMLLDLDSVTVMRLGTGVYAVLGPYSYPMWCDADPVTSGTEVRRINTKSVVVGTGGTTNVMSVWCYELSAGDFVLTDYPFTFHLFAYA